MSNTAKIAIVICLLLSVGVVIAVKRKTARSSPDESSMRPASRLKEPQTTTTQDAGKPAQTRPKPLPRLLDLGAGRCIPCKLMAPILEELKRQYAGRLEVEFIDVWKDPEAGRRYGIRLIPTQIFYDASGREVFRHEGFMSRDAILGKWAELGTDLSGPPGAAGGK